MWPMSLLLIWYFHLQQIWNWAEISFIIYLRHDDKCTNVTVVCACTLVMDHGYRVLLWFQALVRISKIQLDLEKIGGGSSSVRVLHQVNEIESLPIPRLRQIQQQLRVDIDKLEKVYVRSNLFSVFCKSCLYKGHYYY